MLDSLNPLVDVQEKKGQMVVVYGSKGGIGKTMLSINLAMSLNKNGNDVVIWDGAFQFGDIDTSMNLHPSFTIYDLISMIETLNPQTLKSMIDKHKSGVHVLPVSTRPEFAELITPESIQKMTQLLLPNYDYLIVDTSPGLNEQSIGLLEQADKILLVTTLDLVSIKNTKTVLEVFETLGLRNRVQIIINRLTRDSMITPTKALEALKIDSALEIPNNEMVVNQSLNIGKPLISTHAKSNVAKVIFKIAETLDLNQDTKKARKQKHSITKKSSRQKG